MAESAFDPSRLDVAAFAAASGQLTGQWPLAGLPRLSACSPEPGSASVCWSAQGELLGSVPAAAETWLHVQASTTLGLVCQRCLQLFEQPLQARRSFQFVKDEAEAERLDEHSEDDVLALVTALELRSLIEDELMLSLPLIARHDVCPQPLLAPDSALQHNPFAALAALREPSTGGSHDA